MAKEGSKGNRWIDPRFTPLSIDKRWPYIHLDDGSLMAVEGNATIVSKDGGATWSVPRPICRGPGPDLAEPGPGIPSRSGQILCTRDGVIILVWRDKKVLNWDEARGEPGADATGDMWSIRSLDGGQTWIDRQRVYLGCCGHPPINMIQTASGRIVVSFQPMIDDPGRNIIRTYSSIDDGATWRGSNLIDLGGHGHHDGGFEPTFVQLKDGRLWMLIRTNLGRFWEAYSDDDGQYWRLIRPSAIEASTSPGYLARLASGRLVLAWNRLYPEGQDNFFRRSGQFSEVMACWHREELSLAFSEDDGRTWSEPLVVAREEDTWISYPYVFEPEPGLLWLCTGQGDLRVSAREADLV